MSTAALLFAAALVPCSGPQATSLEFAGPFAHRAAEIVKRPSAHAATPWEPVDADLEFFDWFVDRPALAACLWKDLGLEIGSVEMIADGWRSRDPDGVVVEFHRLHRSNGIRAFYCKASTPTRGLVNGATAEIVLLHRLGLSPESDGRRRTMHMLEAWVSAEGRGLRMLMKIAKGAASNAVLRSLHETNRYFAFAASLAERRPQWAKNAVRKTPSLATPETAAAFDERLNEALQRRSQLQLTSQSR